MKKLTFFLLLGLALSCCINGPEDLHDKNISVSFQVRGPGRISGYPDGFDTTVSPGAHITLLAVPDDGAIFTGWSAGNFTNSNPLDFVVAGKVVITAFFAARPSDLVFIAARDSAFTMGSADGTVHAVERPPHEVRFTYNFFLGSCEVTAGEYRKTIQGSLRGDGLDSLPVTNVSWYDAVLYCNARSRAEGYDTVYSYSARCESAGACPYMLENLVIHYERFGYRLPTEAEWEYGCRAGFDGEYFWDKPEKADKYAWYFTNSSNGLHATGGKLPNGFGLFDMAGNAAEWVNDWLAYYADSLYVDPAGPTHITQEQFEASWERPLRGGSYRSNLLYLRSSCRKGPYEMTWAGTQTDIGFRVAMGCFRAPQSAAGTVSAESLSATIACNKSDLIKTVGTHRIRAAFVCASGSRKMCALVDFSESPVTIRRIGDDTAVYAPSISPDGRFIAWSSKGEGASGESIITVSRIDSPFTVTASEPGFVPRWWVDPQSGDTFIVYCDGASLNSQARWHTEKTLRRRISAGLFAGSAEPLWEGGSYHGGLSADGRFLGTAYPTAKLVDLRISDTNIFYFTPPWNGRNDTPQVCNFSMSPSTSEPGEALFLDFGYPGVSSLLNRSYGFHAVIFIATSRLLSDEHISGWFETPAGYDQWDGTEWTNHSGSIVAVARTAVENDDDAVILINRTDSLYLKLLTGNNIREVAAWINPADLTQDDPYALFGKYDVPIQTSGQIHLAKKLRLFWHERERLECVAIGNSPTLYGFDSRAVTSMHTMNIAWSQSSIGASVTVALQYVLPHAPNLAALVLDLDASYFTVDSRRVIPRLTGLYDSKGYGLDSANGFYRGGLPQQVEDRIAAFTSDSWRGFDDRGAFVDSIIGEGWGAPVIEGGDYSLDDSVVQSNITLLEELADSTAARGIKLIVVNYPQNPAYRNTGMAGRAGPSRDTWLGLAALLHEMEQAHSGFHFYDANNLGDHDYGDSEAFDTNHLNARGAAKIAARIDSVLQAIMK